MVVEAVFPTHAIEQLVNVSLRFNEDSLSQLASGEAYRESSLVLNAGSVAEGLAISQSAPWGHPKTDLDVMHLLGLYLGVRLQQGTGPKLHRAREMMSYLVSMLLSSLSLLPSPSLELLLLLILSSILSTLIYWLSDSVSALLPLYITILSVLWIPLHSLPPSVLSLPSSPSCLLLVAHIQSSLIALLSTPQSALLSSPINLLLLSIFMFSLTRYLLPCSVVSKLSTLLYFLMIASLLSTLICSLPPSLSDQIPSPLNLTLPSVMLLLSTLWLSTRYLLLLLNFLSIVLSFSPCLFSAALSSLIDLLMRASLVSLLLSLTSLSLRLLHSPTSLLSSYGRTPGDSCLEYAPDGCPPAYVRLRVTHPWGIKQHPFLDTSCMEAFDGHQWLNTVRLNEMLQDGFDTGDSNPDQRCTHIVGPAGQLYGGLMDCVRTLVCNGPHPDIDKYLQRPRSDWPSQGQLKQIRLQPMCLVLVGHKESPNKHLQARVSWSPAELILLSGLPNHIKQGYIAFKYTFKAVQKVIRMDKTADDGRSYVGSYHLKTTFLHYLEKTPPSKIISSFNLMMSLFHELSNYLNSGKLPHYFLSECDLFATVGHVERQIALRITQNIVSYPVVTILKCPSAPEQLFGAVSPVDLIKAFHHVSIHPSCERGKTGLAHLLSYLDKGRQYVFRIQLQSHRTGDYPKKLTGLK